jgi:hypothetical protein
MGFDAMISSVTSAEYQALAGGSTSSHEVLKASASRAVTLTDEWSALTMLLTGRLLSTDDPADEVLVGSQPVGESARLVPPKHVARIAEELSRLDDTTLANRLSEIVDALEDQVEANLGFEPATGRATLLALASRVKALYAEAARHGGAIVVQSSLFAVGPRVEVKPRPSA